MIELDLILECYIALYFRKLWPVPDVSKPKQMFGLLHALLVWEYSIYTHLVILHTFIFMRFTLFLTYNADLIL